MTRFDGKSAIITGGAGGIGSATCRRFAGEGARVAVFDRDEAGAQKVAREIEAAGGKAQAFACDITDRPSVDAAVAASKSALGPVAILVNNAGFDIFKPGLGSVRCSAFLRGRRRTRTESLPAAVSVSGKPNFAARDKGTEVAVGSARQFAETKRPRARLLIGAHSPKVGKSPLEWDCLVGPGGLEPPTKRL